MNSIHVYCVGWQEAELTLKASDALASGAQVVLRTGQCGCAHYLIDRGIPFSTLDDLYERCEDFDKLDQEIENALLKMAEAGSVCYATPALGDRAAMSLLRKYSFVTGDLVLYAGRPCRHVAASDWAGFDPDAREDTLVWEITDQMLASEMKLRLMRKYGDDTKIYFQSPEGDVQECILSDLDRMPSYDHRACALVVGGQPYEKRTALDVRDLEDILEILRQKCPWDSEQTHASLRKYLLEEAYESADAIDRDSDADLCEELGDVLFQIAFHAQIGKEHGAYEMLDIVDGVCRKMLRRHRHVFGGAHAETTEQVAELWQRVKKEEKKYQRPEEAILSISTALPALTLAQKAAKRAKENGVAFPEFDGSIGGKLFKEAAFTDVDAEEALRHAVMEWMRRIRTESDQNQNI